jgi:hypothetical protein
MITFSTSFVALWAVILAGLTAVFDRSRWKTTLLTAATACLISGLVYGLLYAWSAYNPFEVFTQALAGQAEAMAGRGHSSWRQSRHFAAANLIAFSFCSGLPLVWLWLPQTVRELSTSSASGARWLLLSFGLTLLIVDVAPLYTLETERIWIFLVGFLVIGAAAAVKRNSGVGSTLALAALVLQAAQTIVMEVLLEWVW